MKDYLEVGSAPYEEECVQLDSSEDCQLKMKLQCKQYVEQLRKRFKDFTAIKFVSKRNIHDYGTYFEVAVAYDDNDELASEQAMQVEEHLPATWSDLSEVKFVPSDS